MTPTDHNFIQNEDCQNLNVWTNTLDPEAGKAVIVFLHGGGFSNGSSMELPYLYEVVQIFAERGHLYGSI